MTSCRRCWPTLLIASIAACQTPAAQEETAGLIIDPDAASRAALQRAIESTLGVPDVLLADDALTTTSVVSIERRAAFDAQGLRVEGRVQHKPEMFRLVIRNGACVLVHDDQRIPLKQTHCKPQSQTQNP